MERERNGNGTAVVVLCAFAPRLVVDTVVVLCAFGLFATAVTGLCNCRYRSDCFMSATVKGITD